MESYSVIEWMQKIFDFHDISYQMENEWLIPYGNFTLYPAVRLLWVAYEHNGCLHVEVLHQDGTLMIESFAGVGDGEEAIANGFENLCLNAFHVFAAAFWELNGKDQVEIKEWTIQGKSYQAYIGSTTNRTVRLEKCPELPKNWLDCLETEIKNENSLEAIAWYRIFVADYQGQLTVEVLKNNEIWDETQDKIRNLNWIESRGYYSVRKFIILVASKNNL